MTRIRRRKMMRRNKTWHRERKTKNYRRDVDQVAEDLSADKLEKTMQREVDGDLPGLGQIYCIHCARHFVDAKSLREHLKSKPHKRRVKELSVEPYSQAEADAAAGMGNFRKPQAVAVPDVAVGIDADGALSATAAAAPNDDTMGAPRRRKRSPAASKNDLVADEEDNVIAQIQAEEAADAVDDEDD